MYQSLKEYIRLKTGLQQNSQELKETEARLNAKIDFMASFINLTWPSRLELDALVLEDALKRLEQVGAEKGFSTAIHKNDLMFAFHLNRFHDDPAEALYSYYKVGYETARNLKSISDRYGISPSRLLDFGSGYGRVSRFLPSVFPDATIIASEVKAQAIKFLESELNLNGFNHGHTPDEFPTEKLDLILALSVFTHLPKNLFEQWLNCLGSRLHETGALVFTFLDQDRLESKEILKNFTPAPKGLEYIRRSEDSYFSFVADRIKDDDQYGSTFVSRDWLTDLVSSNDLRIEYLDFDLVPSQDAAIVFPK